MLDAIRNESRRWAGEFMNSYGLLTVVGYSREGWYVSGAVAQEPRALLAPASGILLVPLSYRAKGEKH